MRPLRVTIASAIANARGNRRGTPPMVNILAILPGKLREEVLDDADFVIKALFDEGHLAHPNEGVSDR